MLSRWERHQRRMASDEEPGDWTSSLNWHLTVIVTLPFSLRVRSDMPGEGKHEADTVSTCSGYTS